MGLIQEKTDAGGWAPRESGARIAASVDSPELATPLRPVPVAGHPEYAGDLADTPIPVFLGGPAVRTIEVANPLDGPAETVTVPDRSSPAAGRSPSRCTTVRRHRSELGGRAPAPRHPFSERRHSP
ncbi:hypothetical protein E3T25_09800 [Cryobacterium sandaracinum]|uniref:Uncharacterized protein n=1 Tax=Cryobacterium sandaracinum TaxID=1259247 RepID=A0ABY2JB40_9MICO|nr:hypothetical protein [Cryobacterium sandaracinum]TFD02173.1 hypothetical protein E3T25_09800 [Cryobacterium sandaracinum]